MIFLPLVVFLSISFILVFMASSTSTSQTNTENKSSSPITPHTAYNRFHFSCSAITSSLDRAFKRVTSFCGAALGTFNSHPVNHDEQPLAPPTTIIEINSHDLSSSANSNPTNDSQDTNQPSVLILRTQSLRRIELGPASQDNSVVGLRIYANNTQLVLQYHVTNIQKTAPNAGASLGKLFIGLTYQAAVGFALFHYQSFSSSPSSSGAPSFPLHIVGVATVVGFAASLIGILLRKPYQMPAAILEMFGSLSAASGFFVMMGVFLPRISQWIGWVAGIGCTIAFVLAFLKMKG